MRRRYYESFDIMRVVLMVLAIISTFGLPLENSELITPLLSFAQYAIFTIYGYLVLRDGQDLTVNIKRALKAFIACFAAYLVITVAYLYLTTGQPFMYFTRRGIFNMVVLNVWGPRICNSIWMLQSGLYALILCYIFRGLKKLDWLIFIVLFIFGILVGEGSMFLNFNVLGYTYIQSNVITRTLPYMLLGRLIHKNMHKFRKWKNSSCYMLFIAGLILSMTEFYGLKYIGMLFYTRHFAGFALMVWALCVWAARREPHEHRTTMELIAPSVYKYIYYIYSPLGCILLEIINRIGFEDISSYVGVITAALSLIITIGFCLLRNGFVKDELKRASKKNWI